MRSSGWNMNNRVKEIKFDQLSESPFDRPLATWYDKTRQDKTRALWLAFPNKNTRGTVRSDPKRSGPHTSRTHTPSLTSFDTCPLIISPPCCMVAWMALIPTCVSHLRKQSIARAESEEITSLFYQSRNESFSFLSLLSPYLSLSLSHSFCLLFP